MEVTFDHPLFKGIYNDVVEAEQCSLPAKAIREKYDLTHEEFQELMLLMEFNFLCFVNYVKRDGKWEEVVTPFEEWRQYILRRKGAFVLEESVDRERLEPFSFLKQLNQIMQDVCKSGKATGMDDHIEEVLHGLKLIQTEGERIHPTSYAEEWLSEDLHNQALMLFRNIDLFVDHSSEIQEEKILRAIERGLPRVAKEGWVYLKDFLESSLEPIGSCSGVELVKNGKRWEYKLPQPTEAEKNYVQELLSTRFFQAGIVEVGFEKGNFCFKVTPFGKKIFQN